MTDEASARPSSGVGAGRPGSGAASVPLQLALLLLVAGALRALQLDSPLWYDEIVTLVEFVRLPPAELLSTYPSTNNHLLYSLLAHTSIAVFGESAWALRLPAALLGLGSLAAFWWLAHEIAPARQARLACWGVALSYHHVWFSQNARGYTGILLFTWLGTALFLRARRTAHTRDWLGYAVVLALASWTHLSATLTFAAHGIVYLCDEAWRMRSPRHPFDARPLAAFAGGLGLTALLYAPVIPDLTATLTAQSVAGRGAATVRTWKSPLWTLLEIARSLPFGAASYLVAFGAAAIGATGLASLARKRPFDALLLVLPAALTLAALLAAGFNIWPRYFLPSLGFAAILGVRGLFVVAAAVLDRPQSTAGRGARAATTAAVLAIVLSAAMLPRNYRHPKQDYPAARELVLARRGPSEPVLTLGLASFAYGRYYEPTWHALESVEQLDQLQLLHPRLWIVYAFPTHLRGARPELYERVMRDFEPVRSFPGTLGDGDVHVLSSRATRTPRPRP